MELLTDREVPYRVPAVERREVAFKALERARQLTGLSKTAFAVKLGISRSAYSTWENGAKIPADSLLHAFELAAEHSPSAKVRWTPDRVLAEAAFDWWDEHFAGTPD